MGSRRAGRAIPDASQGGAARRPTGPPDADPELVGRHRHGASPGEQGAAVAVGHPDTDSGPAVFELRLITCGGYDRGKGYSGNVVVFAHLTGIR